MLPETAKKPTSFSKLGAVLYGAQKATGIPIDLALRVSPTTGRARLKNPGSINLRELQLLCCAYDLTHNDICSLLPIGSDRR